MPPLDSWLEFTITAPLVVILLLLLILIGLVTAGVWIYYKEPERIRLLFTRRRKFQEKLGEDNDKTDQSSIYQAYYHFIYNVSHEVSNPLQSIQTNLDNMVRCKPGEVNRWKRYHKIIVAEIRRLGGMTENLRLLSRLETPEAQIELEPVNLKGVIEGVIMALYHTAENRGVRLLYSGPNRPARVLGSRNHLHQVLMNLVDNGIKYSKYNGGEVMIHVQEKQDRLSVRVIDNGIGIPAEDIPYIFDTAYRAPATGSLRRVGTGLGLAIVKRIIEQHGGDIRVESQPGLGTTFTFDLPLHDLS
jgi:two-component system phosphate regulon sensor histidine kinase PhoR